MKNLIFAFVPTYLGKGKITFYHLSYHLVENIVNIYDKRKLDFSWRVQMSNLKKNESSANHTATPSINP